MRGLSKRKGSEVWQGKFRIPQRLWDKRFDLHRLGVSDLGKSQEFTKSLGEHDRERAASVYLERLAAWDAKLAACAVLLEDGPDKLTHQQRTALAADYAKAHLARHEADPFEAPPPSGMPEREDAGEAFAATLRGLPRDVAEALAADLREYVRAAPRLTASKTFALLYKHPVLQQALAPGLRDTLEKMHGQDADVALHGRGLHVDAESRRLLLLELAGMMGATERGLEARRGGDYRPVEALENAPTFIAPTKGAPQRRQVRVSFDAIIDARAAQKAAGQGAKAMPAKSVQKYRRIAGLFAKFRKSVDATTVTLPEVEGWLEAMTAAGDHGNRTVADRITGIGTIIAWGRRQKQHREAMASVEVIAGRVELPTYVEKPASETSYNLDEARKVLLAARHEEDATKRWLPWICLYGGLRVSEANALRREDFFTSDGLQFFRVTSAGKRSLKTANSERIIPVHPALLEEGLVEWVKGRPSGALFRPGAYSVISRWVRSEAVGLSRRGVSPSHGLRHLFVALCRRYRVDGEAAEYLAGHSTPKVHAKYGAADVMLPGLATEMRKIAPLLDMPEKGGE